MTLQQISADINFLCGSNSISYPSGDKLRNINVAYQDVARLIWESADGWQYDDSNATDFGIATTTLVNAQQDYELPAELQRLERVEIKDSAGNYVKLKQLDSHDVPMALTEYLEGGGTPVYYDVVGRSVFLYPAPATGYVTMSAGLKVYFDRNVTELTISDLANSPGFATAFHRILSLAASIDYIKNEDERRLLIQQKDRLEKGLTRFYSKRNVEGHTAIKPFGKKRWLRWT